MKRPKPIEWTVETSPSYSGLEPCWNCVSHSKRDGYPLIKVNRRSQNVHRLIFEECFGVLPDELIVRHRCDNRSCVNPEHLIGGTHADNARDAFERKRRIPMRGDLGGNKKLTQEQVDEIRRRFQSGESQTSLAKSFPVTQAHISKIVRGVGW